MPYKYLFLLLMTQIFVACADPTYVNPNQKSGRTPEQKLSACQSKLASGYCVSIAWEVTPTETELGSFILKTFRPNAADGSPVVTDLEGTMAIVLWMPSMGHGSSPVTVEQVDIGTYRASKVFFTMKGYWEIRILLKDKNEIKDQAIIPISI